MSKSSCWRLAKKILTWLFFIAVAVLLVVYAQKVGWKEVWRRSFAITAASAKRGRLWLF